MHMVSKFFVNFVPYKDGIKVFYNCSEEQLKLVLDKFTKEKIDV